MSTEGLAAALRELGLDCDVEAHDRLAVIVPRTATPDLAAADLRRTAMRMAAEHGFTHLALELAEGGGTRAPLSGD